MSKKVKNSLDPNGKKTKDRKLKKLKNERSGLGEGSKRKAPLWFSVILILIPVLFFVLLELSLRIFNYGQDTSQWVEVAPGKLMLNPDIAYRYFHSTKGIPSSNQNSFDAIKKSNAFRIFILGGSSAAGYPYTPNGDFGRYIQKKLELLYPDNYIEVVNVALTATNSYTMRDLIPGVLEMEPDLILIFAGHNEYYGALGVGSMESIGKSRTVVNLVLSLEKYKTVTLLRDILKWIAGIFSGGEDGNSTQRGTLMSRMAKDKLIALNSKTFNEGIVQFEQNLSDVIEMCKFKNIPVVLGTLTSNLKDQKPFTSVSYDNLPLADEIYSRATETLSAGNPDLALKQFLYAKDLDGLRFRAPEKINENIITLGKQFNCPVVDIYNSFNYISPDSIVGNNLITDHLHPTLAGYKIIGKLYLQTLEENHLLPDTGQTRMSESEIDSLVDASIGISKLDSVVAKFRILILKNDWPFSEKKSVQYMLKLFNVKNYIDSTALKVIDNTSSWEQAHRDVAAFYLNKKDYTNFTSEMSTLIAQYPFIKGYYSYTTKQLLNAKLFNEALPFLVKGYNTYPNAFYSKWIGIISLSQNKTDDAIYYLSKSLEYSGSDPQVLYNLSGAYSKKRNYREALQTINKCLQISPSYPQAENLRVQLERIVKHLN